MKDKALHGSIQAAIAQFGMLRFFPADEFAKAAVMQLLERMATDAEQVNWLVRTILENYDEWPGPRELRAVYCTRFKPADGVEADLVSGRLAAKIEMRAIEAHEATKAISEAGAKLLKQLLPGRVQ